MRRWKQDPTAPCLYLHAVLDTTLNVGLNCALALVLIGPDALDVLDELLAWPDLDQVLATTADPERARVDVLRAIDDRQRGRAIPAQELERLRTVDLGEAHPTGHGWNLLRRLALEP